jgi:hypothetical protein
MRFQCEDHARGGRRRRKGESRSGKFASESMAVGASPEDNDREGRGSGAVQPQGLSELQREREWGGFLGGV